MAFCYESAGRIESRTFPALSLFLAAGLTGLFLTGDAFNFYVFFEIAMISSYILAAYGEERRQLRAAVIFAVVNLLGSVIFLIGIVSLYHVTGTLDMARIAARIAAIAALPEPHIALVLLRCCGAFPMANFALRAIGPSDAWPQQKKKKKAGPRAPCRN